MYFSEEEKAMWLEDWHRSGKRAWTYAKENGLCPQTFNRWTKSENKPGFVEVPAKLMPATQGVQQILIEKGELKIHLPLLPEPEQLRAIFSALGCAV